MMKWIFVLSLAMIASVSSFENNHAGVEKGNVEFINLLNEYENLYTITRHTYAKPIMTILWNSIHQINVKIRSKSWTNALLGFATGTIIKQVISQFLWLKFTAISCLWCGCYCSWVVFNVFTLIWIITSTAGVLHRNSLYWWRLALKTAIFVVQK